MPGTQASPRDRHAEQILNETWEGTPHQSGLHEVDQRREVENGPFHGVLYGPGVGWHIAAFEQDGADIGIVGDELFGQTDQFRFELATVEAAGAIEKILEFGEILGADDGQSIDVGDAIRAEKLGRQGIGLGADDPDLLMGFERLRHNRHLQYAGQENGNIQGGGRFHLIVGEIPASPDDRPNPLFLEFPAALDDHVQKGRIGTEDLARGGSLEHFEKHRKIPGSGIGDVARHYGIRQIQNQNADGGPGNGLPLGHHDYRIRLLGAGNVRVRHGYPSKLRFPDLRPPPITQSRSSPDTG
jgi:hypothetical protein